MKDRRELLKGLAIGSAWATPVVSSVMIPAHGATTCGELEIRCPSQEEWCDCEGDPVCLAERYCVDQGELVCRRFECLAPDD